MSRSAHDTYGSENTRHARPAGRLPAAAGAARPPASPATIATSEPTASSGASSAPAPPRRRGSASEPRRRRAAGSGRRRRMRRGCRPRSAQPDDVAGAAARATIPTTSSEVSIRDCGLDRPRRPTRRPPPSGAATSERAPERPSGTTMPGAARAARRRARRRRRAYADRVPEAEEPRRSRGPWSTLRRRPPSPPMPTTRRHDRDERRRAAVAERVVRAREQQERAVHVEARSASDASAGGEQPTPSRCVASPNATTRMIGSASASSRRDHRHDEHRHGVERPPQRARRSARGDRAPRARGPGGSPCGSAARGPRTARGRTPTRPGTRACRPSPCCRRRSPPSRSSADHRVLEHGPPREAQHATELVGSSSAPSRGRSRKPLRHSATVGIPTNAATPSVPPSARISCSPVDEVEPGVGPGERPGRCTIAATTTTVSPIGAIAVTASLRLRVEHRDRDRADARRAASAARRSAAGTSRARAAARRSRGSATPVVSTLGDPAARR